MNVNDLTHNIDTTLQDDTLQNPQPGGNSQTNADAPETTKVDANTQTDTGTKQSADTPEQDAKKTDAQTVPESHVILDALFTTSRYQEEVQLGDGHTCVLTTRSTGDTLELTEDIEALHIRTQSRYDQMYALYALSYSLVKLDNSSLGATREEKLDVLLTNMPAPLADMLVAALSKFDQKVKNAYTVENAKN